MPKKAGSSKSGSSKAASSNAAGPQATLTLDLIYGTPDLEGLDVSMVAWSPDGKLLTWVVTRGLYTGLFALDVATMQRRQLFDWSQILAPGRHPTVGWDANGELTPWRVRVTDALEDSFVYYSWAPDSKSMIVAPSDDGPYYMLDVATGALSPELPICPLVDDIQFSPDGRWITYVLNYNLYGLDTQTLQNVPFTTGGTEALRYATPDSVTDFLTHGYWWSKDSTRLACLVTNEASVPEFPQQELTSPVGALDKERFPTPGCDNPVMGLRVFGPQGETWIEGPGPEYYLAAVHWSEGSRIALQYLSRRQDRLILALADSDTGQLTPILEERSSTWVNLADDLNFLEKGKAFLWTSERDSYRHIYLYSIDGSQLAQLTSGPTAVVAIRGVDRKNGAVYFRAYPEPYIDGQLMRVTYRFDGGRVIVGPTETLTNGPGAHEVIASPDCSYFAEQFSTATSPPVLNLCDRDGKLVRVLEAPGDKKLSGMLQPVEFPALLPAARIGHPSDKLPLCHRLIRPPNLRAGQKCPAIVYVYSGPVPGGSSRTVINKWFHVPDLWSQMMAQQGFVVYSVDSRGSCEAPRGHDFETAIRYQLGFVELADQLEGVKYLKSLPFVDPERIGVFGGSFGGFMALNCMLRAPDVFKAGVVFAPVTDWDSYDADYTERYMGTPTGNVAGYQLTTLPPLAYKLNGKLLLVHGGADQDVHPHHTFTLVQSLVAADKNVEMMVYPGMTHTDFFMVSPLAHRLFARFTEFFVKHL